ncbi:toxin Cry1Ac domain D-VI-related protein [Bacillus safensis]|uniref:toxin Cry1Ac domain D-VI-related protein n=1 Tax=Bacillus safensis TaxID=561879 RepID=UPI00203E81DB|nr:toxin Cry1Ac domain D-VI-related protein [Bacillus safensis]
MRSKTKKWIVISSLCVLTIGSVGAAISFKAAEARTKAAEAKVQEQAATNLSRKAHEVVGSLFNSKTNTLAKNVTLKDITSARNKVEKLSDQNEKKNLLERLDYASHLFNAETSIDQIIKKGVIVTGINSEKINSAEKAVQKIDAFDHKVFKELFSKIKEAIKQVNFIEKTETQLKKVKTKKEYDQVKQRISKVKNKEVQDKLKSDLKKVEKSVANPKTRQDGSSPSKAHSNNNKQEESVSNNDVYKEPNSGASNKKSYTPSSGTSRGSDGSSSYRNNPNSSNSKKPIQKSKPSQNNANRNVSKPKTDSHSNNNKQDSINNFVNDFNSGNYEKTGSGNNGTGNNYDVYEKK